MPFGCVVVVVACAVVCVYVGDVSAWFESPLFGAYLGYEAQDGGRLLAADKVNPF